MKAASKFRLVDVWVGVRDPRQATKVEHDLIELLVVSVSAVLSAADTFVEIEAWAKEKQEWLRQYLKLEQGIPSHDTLGRVFAAIDPDEFGAAFVRWVGRVACAGEQRRGGHRRQDPSSVGKGGRHPSSPGQRLCRPRGCGARAARDCREVEREETAIPERLATWARPGGIVTIDAMGTPPNIAQTIRDRGADDLLASRTISPR